MSDAAERYARLHAIFDAVRGLSGPAQLARLDAECGDDEELRADVLRLLAARDEERDGSDAFSDSRIEAGRGPLEEVIGFAPLPTGTPERVGDYQIVRRIAEGGMGVVYEAMQESPHRRVALKLLRPTHTTPDHLRRFRQEAELLGRLQHPGIAQVHEAGTYDLGEGAQPFFAMEFVDGVDLRAYCDRAQLDARGRLALLARVCDAVDYAHQRGVIHRDLKPENILVDGHDVPKVLDFGIARTTDDSTLVATRVTQDGQLLGTLAYMAPEQLEGAQDAVSPRTDVYALGVIAFELLAGRPTHDVSGLSLAAAVRHLSADDVPSLSAVDARLRGDVETIVATAAEKEPARRYASAAALATDIRRYLDDQPILARPASRVYRVRKFARRNRVLVAGAASVFAVLLVGIVASGGFAVQADRARRATEKTLGELEQVAAYQQGQLEQIDPVSMGMRLRDSLVETRRAALQEMAVDAGTVDAAMLELQASLDGVNFTTLARRALDESVLGNAEASIDDQFAAQPLVQARLLESLAIVREALGFRGSARALQSDVVRIRREHLGAGDPDTLRAVVRLAGLLDREEADQAEAMLATAAAGLADALGDDHPHTLEARMALGRSIHYRSKEDGQAIGDDAARRAIEVLPDDHPVALAARRTLEDRDPDDAERLHHELCETTARVHGPDAPEAIKALSRHAAWLRHQGRYEEAVERFRTAVPLARQRYGDHHPATLSIMSTLATTLEELDRLDEAERLMLAVVDSSRRYGGPSAYRLNNLAFIQYKLGRYEEAEANLRESIALREQWPGVQVAAKAARINLALVLGDAGKTEEAEELARRMVEATGPGSRHHALARGHLGRVLHQQGRFQEAETEMLAAYPDLVATVGAGHDRARRVARFLVELYEDWDRREPAAGYADEAAAWRARAEASAER